MAVNDGLRSRTSDFDASLRITRLQAEETAGVVLAVTVVTVLVAAVSIFLQGGNPGLQAGRESDN